MFRLAGHLGKTVHEMLHQMPATELDEWRAFDRMNPIGAYRTDLNTAHIAFLLDAGERGNIDDYLIIDPNPLNPELKAQAEEAKEQAEHLAKLKASTARLKSKLS